MVAGSEQYWRQRQRQGPSPCPPGDRRPFGCRRHREEPGASTPAGKTPSRRRSRCEHVSLVREDCRRSCFSLCNTECVTWLAPDTFLSRMSASRKPNEHRSNTSPGQTLMHHSCPVGTLVSSWRHRTGSTMALSSGRWKDIWWEIASGEGRKQTCTSEVTKRCRVAGLRV